MTRMLILADDLTGAADCAVSCVGYGLRALVALDDCRDAGADVLAIDADTRAVAPDRAAATMARIMDKYGRGEDLLLYKKIDSTLRGNVAAELAAVLKARRATSGGQSAVAVLAPAFPANGRTTVNGRILVCGVPLPETDLWKYERSRPPSDLVEMMSAPRLRSVLVDLAAVRSKELPKTMAALAPQIDVLVCDAETESDLRAIADASMVLGRGTIWVGSAGLAYHLTAVAALECRKPAPPQLVVTGPTLFVVGSASSVSRQQVQLLESRPDLVSVRISAGVLRGGEELPEWRAHRTALQRAFNAGVDALLTVGAEERIESAQEPLLASALGEMAAPFADAIGALVATGGETARAVLRAWGISGLEILGEIEPGLPYSIAAGWRRQLPVLTKAGGFGRPETLLHCREVLQALGNGEQVQ